MTNRTVDLTAAFRREYGLRPDVPYCDFCGCILGRRWTRFGARDFVRHVYNPALGREVELRLIGWWAACRRCAPMVEQRAWGPLLNRVMRVRRGAGAITPGEVHLERVEYAALYLQLDAHLTGDITTMTYEQWMETR
jgi:hypothetical protein